MKELTALFQESGHLLQHTQVVNLLKHPRLLTSVRAPSDGDFSENRFVLFYNVIHLVLLEPQRQVFHLPAGSKFRVSGALKTQGSVGTPSANGILEGAPVWDEALLRWMMQSRAWEMCWTRSTLEG